MRASKLQLVVLSVGCLSLVGGVAAGMLVTRFSWMPGRHSSDSRLPLAEQLQLNAAQREQIQQIWENVRLTGDGCYREAQALDQRREDDLMKLLTKEQQDQYREIYSDYQNRYTALEAKREVAFHDAVARTKALLSESQRQKYDAMISNRMDPKPGGGNGLPRPAFPIEPASRRVEQPPPA